MSIFDSLLEGGLPRALDSVGRTFGLEFSTPSGNPTNRTEAVAPINAVPSQPPIDGGGGGGGGVSMATVGMVAAGLVTVVLLLKVTR